MKIYLNGKYVSKEDATISVFDHGLLYGDGVFEGIRVYDGCVFRLRQHLERLYRGAGGIELSIPISIDEMKEVVVETVRLNDRRDGYVRLVVTRGVGDLGLSPKKCPRPTIFCIADKIAIYPKEVYEQGVEVMITHLRRVPASSINPAWKTLNYMNNILAKLDGEKKGFDEVIMLNVEGNVAEGSSDNIFIYDGEALRTPAVEVGALPGITRGAVLDIAREMGIPTEEGIIRPEDLYAAKECFLTGTAAEVVPVVRVDGKDIGGGKVGDLVDRLRERFVAITRSDGVQVYADEEGGREEKARGISAGS
jgi:branched-chain amino acid aminotransferase